MPSGKLEKIKKYLKPPLFNRRDRSSRDPSPTPSRPASSSTAVDTTLALVNNALSGTPTNTTSNTMSGHPGALSGAVHTAGVQSLNPVSSKNMAFERAVEVILQRHVNLSNDDKAAFQSASGVDVMEKLREAQHGASRISDSLTRVQKVLECVNRFMGPLAIFSQRSPEISSLVVGGLNCILVLGLGYIEFFESLTEMMDRIGGHLSYLSKYASAAFQDSDEIQEALVSVYCDLLDIYVRVRGLFTNKEGKQSYAQGFKLFLRVAWEPFEEQFQLMETRLIGHANTVVCLANVEHQILYKNQSQDNERIQRPEILEWLSLDDFEGTHRRHFKKRCKDTGQWLLDDSRFISWQNGAQSSLLWCHGNPGSGKTVLASLVVEHLSKLYELSSNTGVTFIYCNFKESRTPETYIRLAIKQLCRRMESLPPRVHEVCNKHKQNHSQPNLEELQNVLLAIAKHFNSVFLVLDALDECTLEQRTDLCEFFSNIVELSAAHQAESDVRTIQPPGTSPGVVKLLVTSRKEPDIERVFRQRSFPKVEIEAERVDCDIAIYVKAEIDQRIQDERLILRDLALKDRIFTTLTTKSGGMFLWVKFQLDEICAQTSDTAKMKALEKLPKDLNATYERILDSISKKPEGQCELARKVLIFVAYSRSPIPLGLLLYAVAVEDDSESFEALESSIPMEETIIGACANLVSIDRDTQLVHFVHFSVQEYFASPQPSIETLRLGPELGNREIARRFITLLKILHSQPSVNFGKLKYYQYISTLQRWQYHLITGNLGALSVDDSMVILVSAFFEKSPPILIRIKRGIWVVDRTSIWIPKWTTYLVFSPSALASIFNLPGAYEHYQPHPVSRKTINYEHLEPIYGGTKGFAVILDDRFAIHYATIVLNSVPVAQRLCAHGYPINCFNHALEEPLHNFQDKAFTGSDYWNRMQDIYQLSPLYSARSEKMARFLLNNGATTDPQLVEGHLYDPLVWFARAGDAKLVELVSHKIVYQHAQRHSSALLAATRSGRVEIIRLLIDLGANVNAEGREYGTALQAAGSEGKAECIQLLLDKGADVNAEGGEFGTALQAAVFGDRVECIQVLLDNGADVNVDPGKHGTPLQIAAHRGSIECIKLFLDKGADVNAEGGEYGTALQAAVFGDRVECIQVLLDNGADVNVDPGKHGTPLQIAAHRGSIERIKLFLDKGADVNAEGGEYGTALQAAGSEGKAECIQLLLDKGADVNAEGGEFGTALQAAAFGGKVECIQLLLDNGADVNAEGGKYGTTLQAAAFGGKVESIQLLLDKLVDVNARGGRYGTALQAAALQSNVECIQLLLDKGADVHAQGGEYGTALQAAGASVNWGKNDLECIQLLLDKGADVNAEGGEHGTALQVAAYKCKGDCVRFLLDNGADVNARGGGYGNALYAAVPTISDGFKTVQLLLDKGADINAEGGEYGTALQLAAYLDQIRGVELLLNNGADVNTRGGRYGTALQAAAASTGYWSRASPKCIQLLLDKGADVNAEGGEFGTALQAAAFRRNVNGLQLLLDKGAAVNAEGGEYGTALLAASYICRLDIVKLLLGRGADINARGGKYGTALQAAVAPALESKIPEKNQYTTFEVLELLLDHGADITAYVQDSEYGDAITAAKQVWKNDTEALNRFMKLAESRGWKGGEPATQ